MLLISNESDEVNNSLKLAMNKKEAPGSAEAELFTISKFQSKINLYNLIRTKKNPDIWNQNYLNYKFLCWEIQNQK